MYQKNVILLKLLTLLITYHTDEEVDCIIDYGPQRYTYVHIYFSSWILK